MSGQEVALLIGNAQFPLEPELNTLRCPLRDVHGMKDVLGSPEHGPYTVHTLEDQPSGFIRQEIYRVLNAAKADELVLIYYSGHGKVDQDGLYLTTIDTRLDFLPATSVAFSDIKKFVNRSHCDRIILVLDCCYSGAVEGEFRGDVSSQISRMLPTNLEGRGTYILTASSDVELAEEREGDEYGLLTKHIINGIKHGWADRDDDGFVSMTELLSYVQEEVRREGRQKPQGYAIRVQDGQLKVARTGRAPRDQKRRDVLRAVYEAALKLHLPPRIIRPVLLVADVVWCQTIGTEAAHAILDRLHRVCRSEPDFVDALLLLSEEITQIERPVRLELEEARTHCGELEMEIAVIKRRLSETEAGKNKDLEAATNEIELVKEARDKAVRDRETERRARVRMESTLADANVRIRKLTDSGTSARDQAVKDLEIERAVRSRLETEIATANLQVRELTDRLARGEASRDGQSLPAHASSAGPDVARIAAEMRQQKEMDDFRRLGRPPVTPILDPPKQLAHSPFNLSDLQRIKAEVEEQKRADDERRRRA